MILVLKKDNSEQWEDYQEWVSSILEVNTSKTPKELVKEYLSYIKQYFLDNELEVEDDGLNEYPNSYYLSNRYIKNEIYIRKYWSKFKILKKKIDSFETWLFNNYDVKKLEFSEIHL